MMSASLQSGGLMVSFPLQVQLKVVGEEMTAVNAGLEKVERELAASERDGEVSEGFRKVRWRESWGLRF